MEKKFKLRMVQMPNFISVEMPPRSREDGIKESPVVPVKDMSKEEAEEYAEWMRKSFIQHWESKQINHS
jgi:D-serine dehydratase